MAAPKYSTVWRFDLEAWRRAILARMEAQDLTIREAARQMPGKVSHATLFRAQRNRPQIHIIISACQWLGVTLDAFVIRGGK